MNEVKLDSTKRSAEKLLLAKPGPEGCLGEAKQGYRLNSALASFVMQSLTKCGVANLLAALKAPKEEGKKPSFFFPDKT